MNMLNHSILSDPVVLRWIDDMRARLASARKRNVSGATADERKSRDLLPAMMLRFGVDPTRVRGFHSDELREMNAACNQCTSTWLCVAAQRGGASAAECRRFCPNARRLDDLSVDLQP